MSEFVGHFVRRKSPRFPFQLGKPATTALRKMYRYLLLYLQILNIEFNLMVAAVDVEHCSIKIRGNSVPRILTCSGGSRE